MLSRTVCDYAVPWRCDYRVGVPVSPSYLVTHVKTCNSQGIDIAERLGEPAGFQAEGRLVHPV